MKRKEKFSHSEKIILETEKEDFNCLSMNRFYFKSFKLKQSMHERNCVNRRHIALPNFNVNIYDQNCSLL